LANATTLENPQDRTLFGHPLGLTYLFLTEMWERFSYYGMRALLVYYMVKYLFIMPDVGQKVMGFTVIKAGLEALFGPLATQALSSQVYGLYTALVYLTPFFGGIIADRYLGQRRTVIVGAILMAIGHFLMAVQFLFFPALLFLIMGNGAFKPNISTQVGSLYKHGDPRRDRAFSIFYVGINLGSFFSPLVCGTLGETYGWHWGFGAAGVGMIIGLIIYLAGQKYLAQDQVMQRVANQPVVRQPLTRPERNRVLALIVLCFCTIFFWATYEQQGNTMALWAKDYTERRMGGNPEARLMSVTELPKETPSADPKAEKKSEGPAEAQLFSKTFVLPTGELAVMIVDQTFAIKGQLVSIYRAEEVKHLDAKSNLDMLLSQKHLTDADLEKEEVLKDPQVKTAVESLSKIDKSSMNELDQLIGKRMPASWFQSINPLMVFTLTPMVILFWAWQSKRKKEPSSVLKMAIGCILLGVSYIAMIGAAILYMQRGPSNMFWPVVCTFFLTLGELYVSPVGLSLVTKLSPVRIVSMMMGVWFLASFLGNYLAGYIGSFFEKMPKEAFFGILMALACFVGVVLFLLLKPIQRAISSGTEVESDL
jgi:dipeptide/tripeptide permease